MREKKEIRRDISCLLFCEGIDAYYFFIEFLNQYISEYPDLNNIQVVDFGGINELEKQLRIYKNMDGFERIGSIGIIRDAEQDAQKAIREIRKALQSNDFLVPESCFRLKKQAGKISVEFAVLPGCKKDNIYANGTLEDLCMDILQPADTQVNLNEVDIFLREIIEKHGSSYNRLHKNKLHTYLSATNKNVGLKIGEAAKAGAFDMQHEKLQVFLKLMKEIAVLA